MCTDVPLPSENIGEREEGGRLYTGYFIEVGLIPVLSLQNNSNLFHGIS